MTGSKMKMNGFHLKCHLSQKSDLEIEKLKTQELKITLDYFYEIKKLLKCTSDLDFQNYLEKFATHFPQICREDPNEFEKINKILSKIGLFFMDGQVTIENVKKWEKVSLLCRIKTHMPSTTNTLESMHGHINKQCPRRNSFFSAYFRLISELCSKYDKIKERVQHNYRYTKNKTIEMKQKTSHEEMMQMITYYDTDQESCSCGQNKLQTANFKIDIPCMHRLELGAEFSDILPIDLILTGKYDGIAIKHDFNQNLQLPQPIYDEKRFIIQTIRHFSRYKKIDEIISFVETFNTEETDIFYIGNESVSSIHIIEEGIYFFRKLKEIDQ